MNRPDLEGWKDASDCEWKEYWNGEKLVVRIHKPKRVRISPSGGHRIEAEGDLNYYVKCASWTHIVFKSSQGFTF